MLQNHIVWCNYQIGSFVKVSLRSAITKITRHGNSYLTWSPGQSEQTRFYMTFSMVNLKVLFPISDKYYVSLDHLILKNVHVNVFIYSQNGFVNDILFL